MTINELVRDLTKTMPIPLAKSLVKEKLLEFEKKTKEEFLKRILPEEMSAKTINHITWNDNFVKGFNCCIEEIKDNYKNI